MNQPLYLRGCWRDDTLHFDPDGNLKDHSVPVVFTLCGFDLKAAHLNQDKLILEGRRIGLELKDNKQLRVAINIGKPKRPKDEIVTLEIAASPGRNYGPALDAIFVNGLAEFVPSMPSYWKPYALQHFASSNSTTPPSTAPATPDEQSQSPKPVRIGGAVKPPKLLWSKEPQFNEVARRLLYGGTVQVYLQVKPDGTITKMSIVHAVGMGLDERALDAIRQYRFSPATENGIPILVELKVEVNFQIY
jgi:TonB family protein